MYEKNPFQDGGERGCTPNGDNLSCCRGMFDLRKNRLSRHGRSDSAVDRPLDGLDLPIQGKKRNGQKKKREPEATGKIEKEKERIEATARRPDEVKIDVLTVSA